jgi:hypothetical protein
LSTVPGAEYICANYWCKRPNTRPQNDRKKTAKTSPKALKSNFCLPVPALAFWHDITLQENGHRKHVVVKFPELYFCSAYFGIFGLVHRKDIAFKAFVSLQKHLNIRSVWRAQSKKTSDNATFEEMIAFPKYCRSQWENHSSNTNV